MGHWGGRPTQLEPGALVPYRIDLNQAQRAELLQLPGIGENLAARVEEHRRQTGGFHQVEDLTNVRGLGPVALERLRPWVQVSPDEYALPGSEPKPQPAASNSGKKAVPKKGTDLARPVDVNRAGAEELQRLPGVGPKMAQRIIDERQRAPFRSVDELRRVKGIGPKTFERLRPFVTVRPDPAEVASAGSL
jgi:competence protein ComEA